jgi:hypothetical protein
MSNGPTIAYKGGQRFEDTSPTVFDNPLEKLIRTGKRGANWLADLLLGSTPEEEMQTAMESFLSPMATAQGVGRRVLSNVAGPTRRRLLSPPQEIISYHGSRAPSFPPTPRNPLGEFDLGKIGTGEGAQVQGQGLYLSGKRSIGDWYRRRYGMGGFKAPEGATSWRQRWAGDQAGGVDDWKPLDGVNDLEIGEVRAASRRAADRLYGDRGTTTTEYMYGHRDLTEVPNDKDIRKAMSYVENMIEKGASPEEIMSVAGPPRFDHDPRLLEAVLGPYRGLAPSKGSLFEVGIRAAPEELIDLDKPLTAQSSQVQSAVRSIFDPLQRPPILPEASSKAEQMRLFRKFKDHQQGLMEARYGSQGAGSIDETPTLFSYPATALNTARTQSLRDRGVPGAQYLGRTSGERDYVIWDPERLNILRKLAAGVGMVGTGTAAASQAPGTTGQN